MRLYSCFVKQSAGLTPDIVTAEGCCCQKQIGFVAHAHMSGTIQKVGFEGFLE